MRMKRICSFLMIFTLLFSCITINMAAEAMAEIKGNQEAVIVQVLEGDSFRVKLSNNENALVRLIGLSANESDEALNYATDNYLNITVFLVPDSSITVYQDGWNYMYAYAGNTFVNGEMLALGLCDFNAEHKGSDRYSTLSKSIQSAKSNQMGIWDNGYATPSIASSGKYVNINTATVDQLRSMLTDVSRDLAGSIAAYRKTHPFQTVSDILYVNGMTQEIYNKNYKKMHVVTNIRTAAQSELQTLKDVTTEEASAIARYVATYGMDDLTELYKYSLVSEQHYNKLKSFISLSDQEYSTYATPNVTVNINTASYAQLILAGLSETQAGNLVSCRNAMTIKTLNDLRGVEILGFTSDAIIETYADNVKCYTNINTASEYELTSLFGSSTSAASEAAKIIANRPYSDVTELRAYIGGYAAIAEYIYVDEVGFSYCNINTASYDQLIAYGYSEAMAKAITERHTAMLTSLDVTMELGQLKHTSSLYTNINTATVKELLSLSGDMNMDIVTAIMEYRGSNVFTSKDEMAAFFEGIGQSEMYEGFADFVVYR